MKKIKEDFKIAYFIYQDIIDEGYFSFKNEGKDTIRYVTFDNVENVIKELKERGYSVIYKHKVWTNHFDERFWQLVQFKKSSDVSNYIQNILNEIGFKDFKILVAASNPAVIAWSVPGKGLHYKYFRYQIRTLNEKDIYDALVMILETLK